MSVRDLSDIQIRDARRMWGDGCSLGVIAQRLGCSIYDLSPWLYEHVIEQADATNQEQASDAQ